jgi:hypothetical protein
MRDTFGDRRATVVSFATGNPIWPRFQRTTHLASAFEREFEFRVERVPDPEQTGSFKGTPPPRLARKALRPLVLDSFEIPARLALRDWTPSGRGALLIGWPFSPLYIAASRLLAAGIPYVVDAGDPWALTAPESNPYPWSRLVSQRRARAAEAFLWRHAAAGVVTTRTQASKLRALFPDLKLLVRPNGYVTAAESIVDRVPANPVLSELRLVQFGSVNDSRLPIGDWLSTMREALGLTRVRFANYGHVDRPELVRTGDPAVVIEVHDPVDWGRARQLACSFDAAVVTANRYPGQLPSKAIQYLTLPVPRIALTSSSREDELGAFAAQAPGFLAVGIDSREDIRGLIARLRRPWSHRELRPPPGDSWAEVGREIVQFAIESWDRTELPGADHARVRALT